MVKFDKETLTMSMIAKDTGDFVLALDNYLLDEGDTVQFTVNTETQLETPLFQKVITTFSNHKALIHISETDSNLEPGTYWYDIQLNLADGRVDTVVGPAKFKIRGGVTY